MTDYDHECSEERSGQNNHAILLNGGTILIGGAIRRINRKFVRISPADPEKSLEFPTLKKFQAEVKYHTFRYIFVSNDTLDVRGELIQIIEDALPYQGQQHGDDL